MGFPEELKAFEAAYAPEAQEIIVLTRDSGAGAGSVGGSSLWTASMYILAYIDVSADKLYQGDGRIVWPLTPEEKDEGSWRERFKQGCLYRLKARDLLDKTVPEGRIASFYNRFLVVEVLEEEVNESRLAVVLQEYRKPVVIQHEEFGAFELNKDLGFLDGSVNWNGNEVSVSLSGDSDSEDGWDAHFELLHSLVAKQDHYENACKTLAADKLTSLANDWLVDRDDYDGSEEISEDSFKKRIHMTELSLEEDGSFSAYYDDDDMFWGHIILVEGTLSAGPESATIAG